MSATTRHMVNINIYVLLVPAPSLISAGYLLDSDFFINLLNTAFKKEYFKSAT